MPLRLAAPPVWPPIATDDGAVRAIKNGNIIVLPEIRKFAGEAVILDSGASVYPDIVIAATGYSPGLDQMVGKLNVLDRKGVPLSNADASDPSLPGLWSPA
ncbi:hypothetical protein [Mesorhizobium sp. CA13]|uniref:hypothetical protein n=1 Tax=Mesorhizobium sp. CA13 TaxID=2876643 RepID=UPI0029622273|nr:hypothetical protein [Mesorhizobium sp. CA13]